jgi:hypothetical protein
MYLPHQLFLPNWISRSSRIVLGSTCRRFVAPMSLRASTIIPWLSQAIHTIGPYVMYLTNLEKKGFNFNIQKQKSLFQINNFTLDGACVKILIIMERTRTLTKMGWQSHLCFLNANTKRPEISTVIWTIPTMLPSINPLDALNKISIVLTALPLCSVESRAYSKRHLHVSESKCLHGVTSSWLFTSIFNN